MEDMTPLQQILAQLTKRTGVSSSTERLSDEEYVQRLCESYNRSEGKLHESDGYNCETCKNKGYIAVPQLIDGRWYETHRECKCQQVRRVLIRLGKSGLKDSIKKFTFDRYEAAEPWQATLKAKAMEFAKDPKGSWFFIGGQSGAGKTHLCTAIAGAFLKQGKAVRYMLWRDDAARIKKSFTDAKAYDETLNDFKKAEVLYIDDLFKTGKNANGVVQPPTASDVQIAFEILNYRCINSGLITVISTERSIYDLLEIDEATAGRISDKAFQHGYGFNIKGDTNRNYRLRNISDL